VKAFNHITLEDTLVKSGKYAVRMEEIQSQGITEDEKQIQASKGRTIRQEAMIMKGNRRCEKNGKTEVHGRSYA
jgi:hypothetical protein